MTPSLRELDLRHVWHPYTKQSALTAEDWPVIVRGEGVYLYDEQGRRFFDAIASWWACNLGHGHPRVVEAIRRQAGELQHSIIGQMSHPGIARLSAELARLFPAPDRHVVYASDGASAVEAAMKVALQYAWNCGKTGKTRFVSLQDSYHGDTLATVSLGYLEDFHKPFGPALLPVHRLEAPHCAHCPYNKQPATCALDCLASVERFLRGQHATLAAMIVEPLCQGAAGVRTYPARHLARVAELCHELDILLIVDEIAMGYGRTGTFFAFEQAGIDPDIVCLGKGLSGGYLPMSAAVVRDSIYATFTDQPRDCTFYHGHTFCGNPIAAAAALATLEVYREDDIVGTAATMGQYFARLAESLRPLPGVHDVRTLGAVLAVELSDRPGLDGAARARRVRNALFAEGILVRPLGPVVYFMPPLITPVAVLEEAMRKLARAIV